MQIQRLEGHLKSDDFFGVEKFPIAKLVVTGSTPFDKGTGVVSGTLTIKGVTNPIEFKAAMQKKDDGIGFLQTLLLTGQNIISVMDQVHFSITLVTKQFMTNSS